MTINNASRTRPLECLWLSADIPSGAVSGRISYSGGLARALGRAGARVVGVGVEPVSADRSDAPDDPDVEWRPVRARRRSPVTSVASRLPKMAHVIAIPAYRSAITGLLAERAWDAVVIDHLQMGWAAPTILRSRPDTTVVYAAQNHESSVRRHVARATSGSVMHRWALRLDALKAARLEDEVMAASRLVTTVTDADAELFRATWPERPTLVAAPGYGGRIREERRMTSEVPRRAVVLGNFDWHVKQENLRSFLEVADPLFAAGGAEIVVVGPVPNEFVGTLSDLRATTFAGWVDDLPSVLAAARLGIVSEPLGGGFKVKCLDYVFNRVPMAMLSGSAAGLPLTPGRDYLEAPNVARLAVDALEGLDDIARLDNWQSRAFAACRETFDWSDRGKALYGALDTVSRTGAAARIAGAV